MTATAASAADDPREGLAPGYLDGPRRRATSSSSTTTPRVAPFDAPPGIFGFVNSDLAFTGDHAIVGNFNGFQVYDISDPATPTLTRRSSARAARATFRCTATCSSCRSRRRAAASTAARRARRRREPGAVPWRAHLRHQRPQQPGAAARRADLPRFAHAHGRHRPRRPRQHLHLHLRHLGRALGRRARRAARTPL